MGFGKIFDSTFTGSMVGAGPTVFAVWSYIIANAKPPGVVELNPVILAAVIGTTVEEIESALKVLCAPDERSRTKIKDGKRLIPAGEFLYEVPTWGKYRDARNDEERKAYNANAQRKHREKLKLSNKASLTVNDCKHPSAKAEAEAEAEADSNHLSPAALKKRCDSIYSVYPRREGRPKAIESIKKALQKVEYEQLLATTKLYAQARAGEPRQFTPMPATWFNQERYNDDPAGWFPERPKEAMEPHIPDRTHEMSDEERNLPALRALWNSINGETA